MPDLETPSIESIRSNVDAAAEGITVSSRSQHALERNAGWLTLLTGILLLIALIFCKDDEQQFRYCAVALCAFLLSGIVLFTRPLLTEADLNAIFRFSWSFVAVIVVVGVLFLSLSFSDRPGISIPDRPPSEDSAPDDTQSAASKLEEGKTKVRRRPYMLAIVPGCDFDPVVTRNAESKAGEAPADRKTHPGMPGKIHCGDLPPQWVLVIGGNIVDCHFDGSCPQVPDRPNLRQLQLEHQTAANELADAKQRAAAATRKFEDIEILRIYGINVPGSATAVSARETANKEVTHWLPKVNEAKARLDAASTYNGLHRYIDGHPIVGGVVVPVFFIAIAMVGGLINMGRKLTEFQERATDRYKQNYDTSAAASDGTNPPLSREAARDLLVFQNIQVLTTPGIAVLAYSWARPEEQATTVILAFAAGFSSEVFLMAVRGVVDRVIGLGPRPTRLRTLVAAEATGGASKDNVPARGELATKRTSGGFTVGDAVRLEKPIGPCLPGAEGVVLSIEPGGELIVRTTRDHTGAALSFRLQSQPPESFSHIGATAQNVPGPAG